MKITPLNVCVAPDTFKGSLGAAEVAAAIADGWRTVRPDDVLRMLPQADGGEGTLAAVAAAIPGAEFRSAGTVTGPDGRDVPGQWLHLPDGTAVVELAQSSGITLMQHLDPLGASTRGLGEVIAAALDAGVERLIIGIGGSASTDGGAGALTALGLRDRGDRLDLSDLRAAPAGGVRLLTDVRAPLLGPGGAAAVFGPQKGANPDHVRILEERLTRFARLLGGDPGVAGAGAGGGTGYGFQAAWGAVIESGAVAIATLTGLAAGVASTDLVITGEGRFDATSTTGKVVGNVLALAGQKTRIVAGQLGAESPVPAISLTDLAGSTDAAISDPTRWLREAGALLAGGV